MQSILPACFRGVDSVSVISSNSPSTSSEPILTTSIFDTPLGLISLTWSHSTLTLSLLSSENHQQFNFQVKPWPFYRRRSSKSFPLDDRHSLRLSWDLRRAQFPTSGGPEPLKEFYVIVSFDGQPILVSGDLVDREFTTVLVSRREHVVIADGARSSYKTSARFGGKDREVLIEVGEEGMAVAVDEELVLDVRRVRWKFRGTEKVELARGGQVFISWDLYGWLFSSENSDDRRAVFVFRFEPEEGYFGHFRGGENEGNFGNKSLDKGIMEGYFGKRSLSGGKERRRWFLRKTNSSSSIPMNSTSSLTSSSVMEWASQEEVELQKSEEGFTLIVYAWKS